MEQRDLNRDRYMIFRCSDFERRVLRRLAEVERQKPAELLRDLVRRRAEDTGVLEQVKATDAA